MKSDTPLELHVAPTGRDDATGTADRPLATLAAARDALRLQAHEAGATVIVHAGDYLLSETFELGPEDSGTAEARVVYRAAGDGEVRLHGGVEITGFEPYENGIYRADVSGLGLHRDFSDEEAIMPGKFRKFQGDVPGFELFFRGERMDLARWPNRVHGDPRWGEWAFIPYTTEDTKEYFHYVGRRPEGWKHPEEAQIHWFPWYNYQDQYVGIAGVDTERKIINVDPPATYPVQPGRRYYVRNIFEELDAPGEWYYDREEEALYFYPPGPLAEGIVVASHIGTAVRLDGASYVTVRDLTIEKCRGDAVAVRGGEHNIVGGCVIRNVFRDGIHIDGGHHNGAVGNEIHDVGMRGIWLAGGDRGALTPAHNHATNNHIHHVSCVLHTYSPAVHVDGCGNLVRHNLIHDGPHMVIGFHGNDHLLEYNEIHHAMHISSHGGAFYCGRDYTARGNVIRYNSFHDIHGYGIDHVDEEHGVFVYSSPVQSLPGAFGIHLDDQISGFHIHHNLFYRLGHGVIRLGGGRDTIIENNIFFDAGWAVHVDNRGMGWQHEASFEGTLAERLDAVDYRNPPWSERYPELVPIREDRFTEPVDNVVRRNIFYQRDVLYNISRVPTDRFTCDENLIWKPEGEVRIHGRTYNPDAGGMISIEQWRELGFDTRSVVADPEFVDPEHDDYSLSPSSPAWKLGFEEIPFDRIGLYADEYRSGPLPGPDTRREEERPVVEEYPIPGWVPPETGVRPDVVVPQANVEIDVDGTIIIEEYGPAQDSWAIVEDDQGAPVRHPIQAWVIHNGEALNIAVRVGLDPDDEVPGGSEWGVSDGVEIALQSVSRQQPGPVVVLRGFRSGAMMSSSDAGAPEDTVRALERQVSFAAGSPERGVWECEWRIPLGAIGVASPRPAFEPRIRCNITVVTSEGSVAAMWRRTGGESYEVSRAGVIRLTLPRGG